MNDQPCAREREIVNALKTGLPEGELRAHAENCPSCRGTIMLIRSMPALAAPLPDHRLPSHRVVWIKAQYTRKQQRLSMLDLIGLIGMTALGAMLLFGIAAWRFPNLVGGIAGMAQSKLPAYGGGIQFTATLVVFLALVIFGWLITKDRLFQER